MKKRLIIISLILLLITSLVAVDTYALFETNASASGNLTIGRWNIKINDNDITQTQTISLNDFVYNNSNHTQAGYFAPGNEAYFDVEIDASLTDVSVLYSIDIDDSSLSGHPNIYFNVENLDTEEVINEFPMEGVIGINDLNREITLRIYLIWDDVSTYDDNDTLLIDGDLEFVITANFKQYLGE